MIIPNRLKMQEMQLAFVPDNLPHDQTFTVLNSYSGSIITESVIDYFLLFLLKNYDFIRKTSTITTKNTTNQF
jgi:hypothetical protein